MAHSFKEKLTLSFTKCTRKKNKSARHKSSSSVSSTQFNHHCKRKSIYLIRHITQHIRSETAPKCAMVGGIIMKQIKKKIFRRYLHNDVVNGDVDELDKEANETHDCKTNRCGHGNLLKLCINLYKTGMNHTSAFSFLAQDTVFVYKESSLVQNGILIKTLKQGIK